MWPTLYIIVTNIRCCWPVVNELVSDAVGAEISASVGEDDVSGSGSNTECSMQTEAMSMTSLSQTSTVRFRVHVIYAAISL